MCSPTLTSWPWVWPGRIGAPVVPSVVLEPLVSADVELVSAAVSVPLESLESELPALSIVAADPLARTPSSLHPLPTSAPRTASAIPCFVVHRLVKIAATFLRDDLL